MMAALLQVEHIEKSFGETKVLRDVSFSSLVKGKKIDRVIIEYNGMWMLQTLYENLPENWGIYQNMMFADANTFIAYNNNMRQLMFDKILDAEMVVLNRTPDNIDTNCFLFITLWASIRMEESKQYL